MEKGIFPLSPRKNGIPKEVYKELSQGVGRDSPESGSLYSDYESGHQYEQDLPSGYNSGEQYDTLSTGYMSGEAYELPETRTELTEPKLASIEEVSTRSAEDLFSLPLENQLLAQSERLESSSSSSIQDTLDMTANTDPLGGHAKKRKKTVSYCLSVPVEKSPLGKEARGYMELPSDTDTTSCFDSDGMSMLRSCDLQSSDSGAALLHHPSGGGGGVGGGRKKRQRGLLTSSGGTGGNGDPNRDPSGESGGILRGAGRKRLSRKAKRLIRRHHEEFFMLHDNKYWATARQICFWGSILAILGAIAAAAAMIAVMPRSCDPETAWWQGSVILEIGPTPIIAKQHDDDTFNSTSMLSPRLDLNLWLERLPVLAGLGIRGLKLVDLYRIYPQDRGESNSSDRHGRVEYYNAGSQSVVEERTGSAAQLRHLAEAVHAANLTLLVEIPTYSSLVVLSLDLRYNISRAIQFWAGVGVDGISLLGLDQYGADPFILDALQAWNSNFEQFARAPHGGAASVASRQRIFTTSYQLAENIDRQMEGRQEQVYSPSAVIKARVGSGAEAVAHFGLLDARLNILNQLASAENGSLEEELRAATRWDRTPARPWISWQAGRALLSPAQLAFQLLLPGTVSLSWTSLDLDASSSLLGDLVRLRKTYVPIYMNANLRTCHGSCDEEKEDNYVLHVLEGGLVILERHYSRRNRFMLVANFAETAQDLLPVSRMYSDGEVVIDTRGSLAPHTHIKFKTMEPLPGAQAIVIKLPK